MSTRRKVLIGLAVPALGIQLVALGGRHGDPHRLVPVRTLVGRITPGGMMPPGEGGS